jgi:hypothetical protein
MLIGRNRVARRKKEKRREKMNKTKARGMANIEYLSRSSVKLSSSSPRDHVNTPFVVAYSSGALPSFDKFKPPEAEGNSDSSHF